ncbi:tyrosine-protein phosphatase [Mesorhizobium sp. 10J20-29]
MIDLHSHILPGLDDGSEDLATSIAMARIALDDGITHMACTPHIVAGLYENNSEIIDAAISRLRQALDANSLPLKLVSGADVHIAPDLVKRLIEGVVPTLNGSRYVLLEPPHKVLPPRLVELAEQLLEEGFVPIVTHPERLSWIKSHYDVIIALNSRGCLMQVTAGSLTGEFGESARSYALKMLEEGRVDILATDTHGVRHRRPCLSAARELVAKRLGEHEADLMVSIRPAAILANEELSPAARRGNHRTSVADGFLSRLFKGKIK